MLIEILKRTPPWVFVLFFVLLAAGYSQSKTRTVSRAQVSILPAAMLALSLYGVFSAFGFAPVGLAGWLTGAAAAVWLGLALMVPRGVCYSEATKLFSIPGSWLPLALMMAIFFTKYAVGVSLARGLPLAGTSAFIGFISIAYGFLSGLFLARAIVVWHSANNRIVKCRTEKQ